MSRAVYTLRDHSSGVRYVGSTQQPETRFAAHANSATPIGRLIRSERKQGRDLVMHIEEWFADDECGFNAERDYIHGYSKLLGEKLVNYVSKNPIKNVAERCILQGCKSKAKWRGLCNSHGYTYRRQLYGLPDSIHEKFEQMCIEAGILLAEEADDDIPTFDEIASGLRQELSRDLPDDLTPSQRRKALRGRS